MYCMSWGQFVSVTELRLPQDTAQLLRGKRGSAWGLVRPRQHGCHGQYGYHSQHGRRGQHGCWSWSWTCRLFTELGSQLSPHRWDPPQCCVKEVLEPGDPWLLHAARWGTLCPRAVRSPASTALSEMQNGLILLASLTEIAHDLNMPCRKTLKYGFTGIFILPIFRDGKWARLLAYFFPLFIQSYFSAS